MFNLGSVMKRFLLIAVMALGLALPSVAQAGVTQPVLGSDNSTPFNQGVYLDSRYTCSPLTGNWACQKLVDTGGRFIRDLNKLQEIGMHDAIVDMMPQVDQPEFYWILGEMLNAAQARGVHLTANIPYKLNDTTAGHNKIVNTVNKVKGYAAQYGYYIADEPGQHPGEDIQTEKAKVLAVAQLIRSLDSNPHHRIFTVHFGCDVPNVDTFQKPYALEPIIDQAMVDCYPIVPGNDAPDGNGIDQILFWPWDRASYWAVNAQRQTPRVVGQFFSWHQDDLAKPVDWPTYGQVQRERNCAVITGSGIFYFNLDWAWDGPGWPNVTPGKEGRGETYINNVLKAAVQSPMDYTGSQRCIP